jgi:glucuronoarabinoxylan endo-1,4-beta-xylanase
MNHSVHPSKHFSVISTVTRAELKRSAGVAALLSLLFGIVSCGDGSSSARGPGFEPPVVDGMSTPPPRPDVEPTEPMTGETVVPGDGVAEGPPEASLDPSGGAPSGGSDGQTPTEEEPPVEEPPVEEPPTDPSGLEPPIECAPFVNPGSPDDGDINVNLGTEFQTISGFGGINVPGWIADLTPEQVETAFGRGPGQLGLSILRVRIPFDPNQFAAEVPTAQRAVALGAKVMASPWTPPANLKTSNDTVGGELVPANYGAYADHLMSFRDFMAQSGVTLEAISVQNEPDIVVDYESCDWTPQQLSDFLIEQGPRFGDTKLIAAESFNFNRQVTDPLLNNPAAAAEFEIVGGHIYGNGLADYPLARQRGKEVWMTEHYTDSNNSANLWPNALNVGAELHDSMQANFNAYVWWYIRRSYGLITEDGLVSKRGYLMSQYARFIRPGYVRVGASQPQANGVQATAYKNGPGRVVVVAINESNAPQATSLDVFGGCVESFDRFTTSQTKNAVDDGPVALANGRVTVTLDAQSVTTFVSQ